MEKESCFTKLKENNGPFENKSISRILLNFDETYCSLYCDLTQNSEINMAVGTFHEYFFPEKIIIYHKL